MTTRTAQPTLDREAAMMSLLPQIEALAKREVYRGSPLDLEDLVQAAALACWEHLPKFDPGRGVALKSWMERRIVGALKDLMRHKGYFLKGGERTKRKEKRFDIHAKRDNGNLYYDYEDPIAAKAARNSAAAESFNDMLRGLTKFERLIVVMRFRDGKEQKEIAASLGVSESRISQILLYLLAWLKPVLQSRSA